MPDKFQIYQDTHHWFAKNTEIHSSNRHRALEILSLKCLEVMGLDQLSIWFFTIDRKEIFEELTAFPSNNFTQGGVFRKSDFADFFQKLEEEKLIKSFDHLNNSTKSEWVKIPFKTFESCSFLIAPIFSDGVMIGLVFFLKKSNSYNWDQSDENFSALFSDFIGRLIETEKRHAYEKELRHRITYLENDLKRKLEDLNEAKLSLDLALEGAQVGKWEWDLKTNQAVMNKTWFTKLGLEYGELPQNLETFRRVLHPEDAEMVMTELQKHIKGDSSFYECRYRMIMKNGETQWCLDRGCIVKRNSDGTAERMIGVNVNVTPMVMWRESMVLSEQQLKAMIQSLPAAVAMFDKNFNYLAFSAKWVEDWQQVGLAKEGESVRKTFRVAWIKTMEQALAGETMNSDEELVDFGEGNEYWLRWEVRPWKNASGAIGGVIVMAENITSRKEAEIRLAHSSKLSALGEMAGGIAHEINNPLSIIKGYIDLLKRHSARQSLLPELLNQYVAKMDLTVSRISRIVNGMRRFARESSSDEKVNYSLNKIVEETLDFCLERINNNGTAVEVEYLRHEPMVSCRPVEISQVILNLINNAFHATSNFPHSWIKITLQEEGPIYRILISDSGEKISPQIRQKLFQPFFTTKEVGVGTGLGLSISRSIIEEHKGKLYYLDESPNTTFVIELPVFEDVPKQLEH
jgi:PAS domain S-box-containing protein